MNMSKPLVDTRNCDDEPIHLINAIQPHGALLVLEEPDLIICQASANTWDFLGVDPTALIGRPLAEALGQDNAERLQTLLQTSELTDTLAHLCHLDALPRGAGALHVFGNRIDGLLLLELERADTGMPQDAMTAMRTLRSALVELQRTETLEDLMNAAVTQLRNLLGFDRVMAYRFDEDGSGEVIAESCEKSLESYLGLHYPASDIPQPARRMFALLPLRHLPDVDYKPIPLIPDRPVGHDEKPVNLGYCFTRSVSLMYSIYLRNMGVRATLVMPLLKSGKLWGLISCMHHRGPLYLPYEQRIPLEVLSTMTSQLLGNRTEVDELKYRNRLDRALGQLMPALGSSELLGEALRRGEPNLLAPLDAGGLVILSQGQMWLSGKTPDQEQILALLDWLASKDEDVFATHRLSTEFPPASAYREQASGILALRLNPGSPDRIVWFRPEALTDVHWAGNPEKPVLMVKEGDQPRLMPRTSFELWKTTAHGQSRRWLDCEREFATRLRRATLDVMIDRAQQLTQVNIELSRRNEELDSFAYAASHDMKEPLRGIYNSIEFLAMEEGGTLSVRGRERLDTVLQLARRMTELLDALLLLSRVGRNPLEIREIPIHAVVRQAVDVIRNAFPAEALDIDLTNTLPVARCDKVWAGTIFQNLISNAVKYNDQPEKRIEVGCDTRLEPPVFFVRDNGIGIAPENHDRLFELFRRLHGRNKYGSGAGAGLTIVRQAIERHGGRIWVESTPGHGSTFYFTLAPPPKTHS